MNKFVIDIAKTAVLSTVSTLGFLIGLGIYGAGVHEIVEEKTSKLLHKK